MVSLILLYEPRNSSVDGASVMQLHAENIWHSFRPSQIRSLSIS